ncbi:hypothetical protein WFK91_12420, partial [Yersinia enterocolitica]
TASILNSSVNVLTDINTPSLGLHYEAKKCLRNPGLFKQLSRIYSTLADAYQNYSEENEKYRKMVSAILSFLLLLVCYRCRESLIKKTAQSMGV